MNLSESEGRCNHHLQCILFGKQVPCMASSKRLSQYFQIQLRWRVMVVNYGVEDEEWIQKSAILRQVNEGSTLFVLGHAIHFQDIPHIQVKNILRIVGKKMRFFA